MTAVRDPERDGYRAVQLAFGETQGGAADQAAARPPQARRRRLAAPPRGVPRRRTPTTAPTRSARRSVSQTLFEKGQSVKVSGTLEGQGLPGHDPPARLLARSRQPRLAQRACARLDRGERHAVARHEGHAAARPDGQQPRHPAGPRGRRRRRRAQPAAASRARSPGPRVRSSRCAMAEAAPSAPRLGGQGTVDLPAEIFSEPFHNGVVYEAVRAEQLARRRGTASTRDPRRGQGRWRQAVAPEGNRPRTRRVDPHAALDRRRRRLRTHSAPLHREGQPPSAPQGACARR